MKRRGPPHTLFLTMNRVRPRRRAVCIALVARSAAVSADAQAATVDVAVQDSFYSPASLTIEQGTTVRWTNGGNLSHTVTRSGMFNATVNPGESFSHTFDAVGTFSYGCSFHFGMNGTITVVDPSVPRLSVENVRVAETDMLQARFRVSLSAPAPEGGVSFHYTTSNGTAVAARDYTAAVNIAGTIPADESETFVTRVFVRGDALDERNETFRLTLSDVTGATIADGVALAAIIDDDPPPSVVIRDVLIREGNLGTKLARFLVRLSAASGKRVTLAYATANGTARAPGDYLRRVGLLVFLPGQTAKTIAVRVNGDRRRERRETFFVKLAVGARANATLADARGRATILNDDP